MRHLGTVKRNSNLSNYEPIGLSEDTRNSNPEKELNENDIEDS